VVRDHDRVRLFTRNGYDWSRRYPWIVDSALRNRTKQFVIDGEAVTLGVDGRSDFDALHSGRNDNHAQFYAFDMLELGGSDMRSLPLSMRKTNLSRLLAGRSAGIFLAPYDKGEIGPDYFGRPASSGWKASSPSIRTARIGAAGQRTG
jgi:ATP-dependent DNA ligase